MSPEANTQRALVKFDLSSLADYAGNITSVKLALNVDFNGNDWAGGGSLIDLHRAQEDWNESQATWRCASAPVCGWDGGDFSAAATDSVDVKNINSGSVQLDVMADVAQMLATGTNYGWALKKRREDKDGSISFSSKEGAIARG
ncbi:DNRLRE domain-containing protein [Hahella sp. KA22]|uniref:DNRLRE domain-containing protein n=1 Tax=Hahella sp. KA22 TaxID=1628392 RepID=UPI000FDDEFF0|nr:DNRLRE domain-containing protein [Hahella sp. KA22]AZZ91263.1 DNRLRE domain-containing protein [Hahella sp. KA22]QAY54631.1 DNRLRE domain-containing protein [Hahella sp. KA22]